MDSLLLAATGSLGEFRSVVVKGSRFMKMERVVQALQSHSDDKNSQNKDKKGEPHAA
jgi:UDP-N-acetylmuramoyl-tripeptide--D-alanyl-D-alanine ligase